MEDRQEKEGEGEEEQEVVGLPTLLTDQTNLERTKRSG